MKIITASAIIMQHTPDLEATIELAGRVCYKSEDKITRHSAADFIGRLHESKHESVLEHGSITVRVICDRGVSHELVRHRIASFSQESTRYCNYGKGKFGGEITVIDPSPAFAWTSTGDDYQEWHDAMTHAEQAYLHMLARGASPQAARAVLPNSLKTEVVMTANPREWLHVFRLRTAPTAHPQMREIMIPLAVEFSRRWPAIFSRQPSA